MESKRLISRLSNPKKSLHPVILPDFFVDHFVRVPSFESFIDSLKNLATQGGGNLLGNTQFIRRGGNTVNTASALLELGLDPKIIVTTDDYGHSLLQALADPRLDLSHVHTDGRLSSTVSIETRYEEREVNLMISDSGSAADFAFSDLTEDDLSAIRESGLVALVNLNHNQVGGKLAADLFEFVRENTSARTIMDIGDPSNNPALLEPILRDSLQKGLVDTLSLNENEALWLAEIVDKKKRDWRAHLNEPARWLDAAEFVSGETGTMIAMHTPFYGAIIDNGEVTGLPSFMVETTVALGAGDVWNAGLIYSLLQELPSSDSLLLANAIAALYVSSTNAVPPSLTAIHAFLESPPAYSDHGNNLLKR